jgi:phosphoglycerol transferase MdoB-like AlkP superfamily enzyme
VFAGACDRDVPAQLASTLKGAQKPQFLYWLTVNSHLPVVRDKSLGTEECASFDRKLDAEFPMTCRLLSLFDQTGQSLAREITATDFPASDILIVGDHIPPFFDRHHRQEFAPDRVPWVLLRPKAEPAAAAPKLK